MKIETGKLVRFYFFVIVLGLIALAVMQIWK